MVSELNILSPAWITRTTVGH